METHSIFLTTPQGKPTNTMPSSVLSPISLSAPLTTLHLRHPYTKFLSISPKPNVNPRHLRCRAQLLHDVAPVAAATYGTLLLTGGVFAYLRSGSKGSAIGGFTGGALLAAAYYLMQTPDTVVAGEALAFGSAFLFSAVFAIRLAASRKLVPAGPLLALSLGSLAVFASAYLQDKL